MLVVVATPREWFAAFAVYAAVLVVVIAVSRVPVGYLAKRMVVEVPFVVFAALMPFVATGPQVEVLGRWLRVRGRAAGAPGRCWSRAPSACSPR